MATTALPLAPGSGVTFAGAKAADPPPRVLRRAAPRHAAPVLALRAGPSSGGGGPCSAVHGAPEPGLHHRQELALD